LAGPRGYLTIVEPGKKTVERDTITCGHCNSIVIVKPGQDPATMGGFCLRCMKHTCNKQACNANCTPFMKKIEKAEQQDRFRRAVFG
jgi:hypothetical protein